MKVTIGLKGVSKTWQDDFPDKVACSCGGKSLLAFVAHEGIDKDDKYKKGKKFVSGLLHTTGQKGGLWLHDACAVAVYFCRNCLQPTAKYNQA